MKRLYEVYENNKDQVGEFLNRGKGQRFTLIPLSHVSQNAHIEVVLDQEGNFFKASVVPKEDTSTIVPATLDSANRAGSKVAPHYLHDKLSYVAGDYLAYGGNERRADHFKSYMKQMREWVESPHNHPYVEHIYNYLNQQRLVEDLIDAGVLYIDENEEFIDKWTMKETEKYNLEKPEVYKVVAGKSSDALVRFRVISADPNEPVLWENPVMYECFQDYLADKMQEEESIGYCYVTGEQVPLTERHGSRLRNAGDMSKLISSNDSRGFTYRGRFNKADEAVQIGYDVSQKAHNALRWLIQRQGFRSDTRSFVTFGIETPDTIQPFDSSLEVATEFDEELIEEYFNLEEADQANDSLVISEQVVQALQGKTHNFELDGVDEVIVLAVDAATTGRLAIVYYQELDSSLFLDHVSHWHNTCKWYQTYYDSKNKKVIQYEGTPSTYQIVQAVYGAKADEKIKKELYTRLLPCIVDKAFIPKDIVRTIYNRVKNPMSFEGNLSSPTSEWQRTLNIACALIYKQFEKEEIEMPLDETNHSRDYLFGRLLGVAEVLERNELQSRDEKRATNATRYFNAFSQRPARTWMTIRRQLNPYQIRRGERVTYFNKIIQEIENNIEAKDMNNDALGPLFLLGYSSQVKDLYTKKEDKKENNHVSN